MTWLPSTPWYNLGNFPKLLCLHHNELIRLVIRNDHILPDCNARFIHTSKRTNVWGYIEIIRGGCNCPRKNWKKSVNSENMGIGGFPLSAMVFNRWQLEQRTWHFFSSARISARRQDHPTCFSYFCTRINVIEVEHDGISLATLLTTNASF